MDTFFNLENDKFICINSVKFHQSLLSAKVSYFAGMIKFHNELKNIIDDPHLENYSKESIIKLKQVIYEQPIDWLNEPVDLIIECYNLGDYLCYEIVNKKIFYQMSAKLSNKDLIKIINGTGIRVCYREKYLEIIDQINNKNFEMYNKAVCVKDEKQSFELHKLNWEEYKDSFSLHNLAVCYANGTGCQRDKKKYKELMDLYNSKN